MMFFVESEVEVVEEPELAIPELLQPGLLGFGVDWVWVPGRPVARLGFRRCKRSQNATPFLSVFSFVNTEVQTMEEAELVAEASFEPFLSAAVYGGSSGTALPVRWLYSILVCRLVVLVGWCFALGCVGMGLVLTVVLSRVLSRSCCRLTGCVCLLGMDR
jgi:hypothetical protein